MDAIEARGWSTSGCKYLKDLKGLLGAEIIRVVPSTRENSLSEYCAKLMLER